MTFCSKMPLTALKSLLLGQGRGHFSIWDRNLPYEISRFLPLSKSENFWESFASGSCLSKPLVSGGNCQSSSQLFSNWVWLYLGGRVKAVFYTIQNVHMSESSTIGHMDTFGHMDTIGHMDILAVIGPGSLLWVHGHGGVIWAKFYAQHVPMDSRLPYILISNLKTASHGLLWFSNTLI